MTLTAMEWTVLGGAASALIGVATFFIRRLILANDEHGKDIQHIKQTYVTKEDFSDMRKELRVETKKLSENMEEVKDKYLTKDEYFRTQAATEKKLDKMYDLLLKMSGGVK